MNRLILAFAAISLTGAPMVHGQDSMEWPVDLAAVAGIDTLRVYVSASVPGDVPMSATTATKTVEEGLESVPFPVPTRVYVEPPPPDAEDLLTVNLFVHEPPSDSRDCTCMRLYEVYVTLWKRAVFPEATSASVVIAWEARGSWNAPPEELESMIRNSLFGLTAMFGYLWKEALGRESP